MNQCSKCNEIKSISEFYKDKSKECGHKPECKECSKKDMKRTRRSLKTVTCTKCELPKEEKSFRSNSTICRRCEYISNPKASRTNKSSTIGGDASQQSVRANSKTRRELHDRNVKMIKKKGYIEKAEIQQLTKIIKPDLYSAQMMLRVDNRLISYQTGEFKTEFELEQSIELVYQDPTNAVQQYLGVVS